MEEVNELLKEFNEEQFLLDETDGTREKEKLKEIARNLQKLEDTNLSKFESAKVLASLYFIYDKKVEAPVNICTLDDPDKYGFMTFCEFLNTYNEIVRSSLMAIIDAFTHDEKIRPFDIEEMRK